ncbi:MULTISPECIES: hypothetical protein [Dasania]|nr:MULTISPECIES: hypothetical protein [Dasania]
MLGSKSFNFFVIIIFSVFLSMTEFYTKSLTVIYRLVFYDFDGVAGGVIVSSENIQKCGGYGCSDTYNIVYEYKVLGKAYRSSYVRNDLMSNDVNDILNKYTVNKKVDVYYSLKDHSVSVLDPSGVGGAAFLQVFYVLIATGFGYSILKEYRK